MPPDVRDAVVDFVRDWAAKVELPARRLLGWAGLAAAKYHAWTGRYGQAHEPNGPVPRDHWLTAAEKNAILDFHHRHPLEGYRRLTYMMMDRDVVAHYNTERLHSAIGYVTPHDFLAGRQRAIHAARDRKLDAARDRRRQARRAERTADRKEALAGPPTGATLPIEWNPAPDPLSSSPTPTNSGFR